MKQGKTLTELAIELDRQNSTKRDFIADTKAISMKIKQSETNDSFHTTLTMRSDASEFPTDNINEFDIGDTAHHQIAQRLSIPQKYYDRMNDVAPHLLVNNVNHWLHNNSETRMVRTLDGKARAFLSDRYRTLDNYDLAQSILPVLGEAQDMQIISSEMTEKRLYIKALFPKIEAEIGLNDVVQSGIVISNSEIGNGSLRVEPLVYRLVCLNGMISNTAMRKYHVGRANDDANEGAIEIFRDETLMADDKAFWMKVQDTVRASLSDTMFKKALEQIQIAQGMIMEDSPVKVIERAAKSFGFNEGEKDNVLEHLIKGGDLSAWGLCNAVTRASQDISSYDRATEFERLGGQIIELPKSQWKELAVAA